MNEPKHLYEAALRLRNDPMLAPFKEWLVMLREDVRTRLETADPSLFQLHQGEAKQLRDILSLIENSSRVLEKKAPGSPGIICRK